MGVGYRQTANWRVKDGDVLGQEPPAEEVCGGQGGIGASDPAAQEPEFLELGLWVIEHIPSEKRWSVLLASEFLATPDSG